jgi:MoxR-like ATPase
MPATKKKNATKKTDPADVRQKILQVESELQGAVLERDDPVHSIMLALLTRQHVLLLGPPGTGKSYLTKLVGSCVDAKVFDTQLGKDSRPGQLVGPLSPKALAERDEYVHIDGGHTIRRAPVAYLDEIFKSNTPTLNALLSILNERVFYNGTRGPEGVALNTAIGCSNEYPQGDNLGALYDRFLFRHWIGYLQDDAAWERLMFQRHTLTQPTTKLTMAELAVAQADVLTVGFSADVAQGMGRAIKGALGASGIVRSERRWVQALHAAQAEAWLAGRTEVTKADLLCWSAILWDNHELEGTKVSETLLKLCAPKLKELLEVMDLAWEQVRMLRDYSSRDDVTRGQVSEAKQAFSKLQQQAEVLIPEAGPQGSREAKRLLEMSVEAAKLHGAASW